MLLGTDLSVHRPMRCMTGRTAVGMTRGRNKRGVIAGTALTSQIHVEHSAISGDESRGTRFSSFVHLEVGKIGIK